MHNYTARIIIRKDIPRQDGTCLLSLQCFINKKRVVIALNQHVFPEQLHSSKQGAFIRPAKGQTKKAVHDLNIELANALAKASDIFTEHRLSNRILSPEIFKQKFTKATLRNDFYDFWEEEVKKMKEYCAPATIDIYGFALDKLKKFRNTATFADLDNQFIDDFNRFLFRQKLSQNTVSKYHIRLKKMINLALRYNIMHENPYRDFRLKFQRTNRTYLTMTEQFRLLQLYDRKDLLPHLQNILARFLFSCFTSLRYSDNVQITADNISENTLIIGQSRKTRNVLRIPLSAPGKRFLSEIIDKNIPALSLQRMNSELKIISEAAKVQKILTTHVGRHTYATTYLKLGGRVEVLQKILDHSKLETTMVYVHITEADKQESVEMFNVFMRAV